MESLLNPSKTGSNKVIDDALDADELAFLFANHQAIAGKRQYFDIEAHQPVQIAGLQEHLPQIISSDAVSDDCPDKLSALPATGAAWDNGALSESTAEPAEEARFEDMAADDEDIDRFIEDVEDVEDAQVDEEGMEDFELDDEDLDGVELFTDFVETDLHPDASAAKDDVAWALLLDAEEEFDPDLTGLLDETEVETGGRLTDNERALQMAAFLGERCELGREEVGLIAEIFAANGWAACKTTILDQLAQGTTVEELYLAWQVKELWKGHYEFYNGQGSNYRVLNWLTALCIIRAFDGYPDPEEVEHMLIRLYDHWRNSVSERRISKTFNEYIFGKFRHGTELSEFRLESIVEGYWSAADLELFPPSTEDIPELTYDQCGYTLKTVRNFTDVI